MKPIPVAVLAMMVAGGLTGLCADSAEGVSGGIAFNEANAGFSFNPHPEFPGAKGELLRDGGEWKLLYDFSGGGHGVGMEVKPAKPFAADFLTFEARHGRGHKMGVMVRDSAGQFFFRTASQVPFQWCRYVCRMDGGWPIHWGGANDGKPRPPFVAFAINADRITKGTPVPGEAGEVRIRNIAVSVRKPLKGPPANLKGANRYVQRRETHFKWFYCSLVDKDHLKVEMKDLNYWAQSIPGTKVDLGSFVCTRIPAPGLAPDIEKAVYGKPVDLLANGLADWDEMQKAKPLPNQWSFKDGVLSTAHKLTPEGGWVAGCNLRTKKADFGDCKISFDFRLPEFSNSGVWLRGNYEINVCDSYGWAIDNRNSGVLCGLFEPLVSAERKFGEWQHIDCWYVNRHCTIVLNGKVTMDNAPVYGITGGAMTSDVNALGPIILQGDHSGCDFRNMVLTPILSCPDALPLELGYTRIFNGKDLDGWIGATNLFYARNGRISDEGFSSGERLLASAGGTFSQPQEPAAVSAEVRGHLLRRTQPLRHVLAQVGECPQGRVIDRKKSL